MKVANFFWGVILILLGLLIFFSKLDIIEVNWAFILNLWPLLIIFLGVYFLPGKIRTIGVLILTAVITVLFFYSILEFPKLSDFRQNPLSQKGQTDIKNETFDLGNMDAMLTFDYDKKFKYGRLDFSTDRGRFKVDESDDNLFALQAEEKEWQAFKMNKQLKADTGIADLSLKGVKGNNPVTLALNEKPIWHLRLNFGKAKADLDFSPFKINRLQLKAKKAQIMMALERITKRALVSLNAEDSKVKIEIPENLGCKIVSKYPLGNADLEDFNAQNNRTYTTPDYQGASKKLTVRLDEPLKNLTISRD